MKERIQKLDWGAITQSMNDRGYAEVGSFITTEECEHLKQLYDQHELYRKTVTMERHRFGKGEYKYFSYPLPNILQEIRQSVYPLLVPVANQWNHVLNINNDYPNSLIELQKMCAEEGQLLPTVLILNYEVDGFNTLHQDLYGEVFFPFQLVLFLDEYGSDYEGGEFVMTEQVPRAQSKATVIKPKKGTMLIFTTNYRPIKGSRGYYRARMRHGVSEVKKGNRHTLGIIFHDAKT